MSFAPFIKFTKRHKPKLWIFAVITALYLIYCFYLWVFGTKSLPENELASYKTELLKDFFLNYFSIIGTFFIGFSVWEQIKITRITEKQFEIANRPNISVKYTKGDGAVGSQSYKITCTNHGQGLNYIKGLDTPFKNKNLTLIVDLSDRYMPPNSTLEFSLTFKYNDHMELLFLHQEVDLYFLTLDNFKYQFKFGLKTSGEVNYISLLKCD